MGNVQKMDFHGYYKEICNNDVQEEVKIELMKNSKIKVICYYKQIIF